jgi:hypothetical protein
MKKNKKAQLAMPFHWIFILIAGALILLFFVTIIFKQKAVSEEKLSAELISSIEEIFAGAGAGEEETIHVIDIPKTEFNFVCEEETGVSEYSIKGTGVPRQTPTEIMFSPDLVKGKELIIWSLPFRFPFKITNFLLVSSSDARYIIYHKDTEAETNFALDIKSDMPEPLTINTLTDINQIPDTSNYKIKFIFVGDIDPTAVNLAILSNKPDKDVSAVKIESDHVIFYEKQVDKFVEQEKGSVIYLPAYNDKDAMYFAAIFAEDANQFRCNLKKILKRLKLVTEIYKERTERLRKYYENIDPQGICTAIYPIKGFSGFDDLLIYTEDCLEDLDPLTCYAENFISSISNPAGTGIEDRNNVLKEQGCLLIY